MHLLKKQDTQNTPIDGFLVDQINIRRFSAGPIYDAWQDLNAKNSTVFSRDLFDTITALLERVIVKVTLYK